MSVNLEDESPKAALAHNSKKYMNTARLDSRACLEDQGLIFPPLMS